VTHDKENGLTAVPSETASPALCRAPPKYSRHRKKKKEKESKAGRGPPPPGHDHAVAGRRSSVPHASDATTTSRRPHRSVRRCLTSAARRKLGPPGAWAAARVGRESQCRGRISGLRLRDWDEDGGSRRAAVGAGAAAAASKSESRRRGRNRYCLVSPTSCNLDNVV
jgi:hypothetical protein